MIAARSRQVRKLVRKWQRLLRLRDWEIGVVISRVPCEGPDHAEVTCANIGTMEQQKVAQVTFFPGAFEGTDADLEKYVIHELLHVHFAPFGIEPGTPLGMLEENAIYAISEAFAAVLAGKA